MKKAKNDTIKNDYDTVHENMLDDHGGRHVSLEDRTEAFGLKDLGDDEEDSRE